MSCEPWFHPREKAKCREESNVETVRTPRLWVWLSVIQLYDHLQGSFVFLMLVCCSATIGLGV